MLVPNRNYGNLKDSYLFYNIAQKIRVFEEIHPELPIYRMGIGDVSLPLCTAVTEALHKAVEDQASAERFHGYMPECGDPELRKIISDYYRDRGLQIKDHEVFISSGASDELGDILELFDVSNKTLVIEPAYPAYADANILTGRSVIHMPSGEENGFIPEPDDHIDADLIYICSPNNPTGAVFSKEQLRQWVEYANRKGSIILFDAAYEAFVEDPEVPRSIFETEGSETCAIEICSLSKTAGFTGTRLGYTIIPDTLERKGMNFNSMWVRNRTTRTNGISYILQKAGAAVFSEEGQHQIHENLNVYKNNARTVMRALDDCGIWYTGGKNSPYIWMRCPKEYDSWGFFDLLLNEIQVTGTPGAGFGACGEGYFRLSTFSDPADTLEASMRLRKLLS